MIRARLFLFLSLFILPLSARAALPSHVRSQLIIDTNRITPGQPFRLGVLYSIDPQWHIYGPEKSEIGLPTKIEFQLPPGFIAGPLQYPKTKQFNDAGLISFGYENEVLIFAQITPPAHMAAGQPVEFGASTKYLVCKIDGQCIPGQAELKLVAGEAIAQKDAFDKFSAQLSTTSSAPAGSQSIEAVPAESQNKPNPSNSPDAPPFSFLGKKTEKEKSLAGMLLFAFLGGMILNIMPCVLPVLSIKILSFVRQSGQNRARTFHLGLVFAAGVLVSFLILAAFVVALQWSGMQLGWGFQFSEPRFTVFMSALILIFALGLFGVIEFALPGAAMQSTTGLQSQEGATGAFFNGVLATALATPCTAPLLGPALGFAFIQPAPVVILFFLVIGLGLAAPYVLLSAFPQWLAFLPKPGRWMETFKQFMGFLLLATLLYLVWLFGRTSGGTEGITALLAFLLAVSIGCWLIGREFGPTSNRGRRIIAPIAALIIAAGSYAYFPERHLRELKNLKVEDQSVQAGNDLWEPFSKKRVEKLVAQKRNVFLDFTADWCLTCKVNETTVLSRAEVLRAFKAKNVALVRADYTRQPEDLTRIIRYFGRAGVPLYIYIPASNPSHPVILPEALRPSVILRELR